MGSIRILPVEETFTSQEYSIWEDVEEDSETLSLHPVDYFEPEAYVAIHLKEGVDRGMWYGTIEDCDDLKLSLEAYLEALLRTRGYFYWPKAVAADVRGRSGNSDADLLRMWMPRLFADYDEQVLFRGRYAEAAAAASSARQARMATIRSALEAAGVDFESRDDGVGTINIHFPNTPENNGRLAAGAKTLGVDLSDEGWHVRQIGSLVFHKETA